MTNTVPGTPGSRALDDPTLHDLVTSILASPVLQRLSLTVSNSLMLSGAPLARLLRDVRPPSLLRLSLRAMNIGSCRGLLDPCPPNHVQHYRLTLTTSDEDLLNVLLYAHRGTFQHREVFLWHILVHATHPGPHTMALCAACPPRNWRLALCRP